ncbi:MAG: hypothetical protein K0S68_1137 [Candidatus Saccharibacteria bacterium]|jgi:hypothetical protein|nr:hypothetical protein [Candidatus Saccharibacteria bacterium]
MKNKQSGFAVFELILLVVVVGILGFTVYNFVSNRASSPTASNVSVPNAPQISSANDLVEAGKILESVNVDEANLDSTNLDSELSAF